MEAFPVAVTIDGKRWSKTKMIVTAEGTTFYRWDVPTRTGVAIWSTPSQPVPVEGTRRGAWDVDGVRAIKGCAPCSGGGPLARWRPQGGPARVATSS